MELSLMETYEQTATELEDRVMHTQQSKLFRLNQILFLSSNPHRHRSYRMVQQSLEVQSNMLCRT